MEEGKMEENEEEIVPEESEDSATEPAALGAKLKRLRAELKKCQGERAEYLTLAQRLKADYTNSKREAEASFQKGLRLGREGLILDLLQLADAFELAMANQPVWEQAPKNWRAGIEHIYQKLIALLQNLGVTQLEPLGQTFNPAEHESIGEDETSNLAADHTITAVVQRGYRLDERLLRPAKVKIGIFKK